MGALESVLAAYNRTTDSHLDLVFYKEAVQHLTRLTRVMVGAHLHKKSLLENFTSGVTSF